MHCIKKKSSSISVVPLFSHFVEFTFETFHLLFSVHIGKGHMIGCAVQRERQRDCVFLIIIIITAATSLIQLFFARIYVFKATTTTKPVHNIFIHRKASYLSFIFAVAALTTSSVTYIHSQRERNMMIIITLHSRLITRLQCMTQLLFEICTKNNLF